MHGGGETTCDPKRVEAIDQWQPRGSWKGALRTPGWRVPRTSRRMIRRSECHFDMFRSTAIAYIWLVLARAGKLSLRARSAVRALPRHQASHRYVLPIAIAPFYYLQCFEIQLLLVRGSMVVPPPAEPRGAKPPTPLQARSEPALACTPAYGRRTVGLTYRCFMEPAASELDCYTAPASPAKRTGALVAADYQTAAYVYPTGGRKCECEMHLKNARSGHPCVVCTIEVCAELPHSRKSARSQCLVLRCKPELMGPAATCPARGRLCGTLCVWDGSPAS
jgi:hypothetical protein